MVAHDRRIETRVSHYMFNVYMARDTTVSPGLSFRAEKSKCLLALSRQWNDRVFERRRADHKISVLLSMTLPIRRLSPLTFVVSFARSAALPSRGPPTSRLPDRPSEGLSRAYISTNIRHTPSHRPHRRSSPRDLVDGLAEECKASNRSLSRDFETLYCVCLDSRLIQLGRAAPPAARRRRPSGGRRPHACYLTRERMKWRVRLPD
ncbi:hypothetical protein EVAR_37836_1 [Eumeta japonica]|uniref:Uncharacterized protein n=1 Tax=Eumeta variegata TaxID=151549 RepID=A0A4C1X4C5_EUMVA|nr:hypothetical protein EVAR_37836_1 [Eumeta japonica]